MILSQAVKHREDEIKNKVFKLGYFKTPDNKQLYELNLTELEQIYENEKCRATNK